MISNDIKFKLKLYKEKNDTSILMSIIDDNKERADKLKASYETYKGNHAIRSKAEKDESNTWLPQVVPYPNLIVKEVVGYMTGKPPTIQSKSNQEKYDNLVKQLKFHKISKSLLTYMSSTSESYIYYSLTDVNNNIYVESVPPWEMIIFEDKKTEKVSDAIRYYYYNFKDNDVLYNKEEKRLFVEHYYLEYDKTSKSFQAWVKFYIDNGEELRRVDPILYDFSITDEILYLPIEYPAIPLPFGGFIPFVLIPNNEERQSDFEVVQSLIDGNDINHSNSLRDLRRFANAILKSINAKVSKDDVVTFKEQGFTVVNCVSESGELPADMQWLIKDLSKLYEFLEWMTKTYHKEILFFSHRFDPTDEDFRLSYESIQYIIMMLENQSNDKEGNLVDGWLKAIEGISQLDGFDDINVDDLELIFFRSLPKELKYYMEAVKTAIDAGYPLEVILRHTPFSGDASLIAELKQLTKQENN